VDDVVPLILGHELLADEVRQRRRDQDHRLQDEEVRVLVSQRPRRVDRPEARTERRDEIQERERQERATHEGHD
jgi:hypothetical protein